ncbi:hypothetical protein COCNU_scaffold007252G000010 [Cocos nucifera]|nr:hypothetical protein [Cocos nucifera]
MGEAGSGGLARDSGAGGTDGVEAAMEEARLGWLSLGRGIEGIDGVEARPGLQGRGDHGGGGVRAARSGQPRRSGMGSGKEGLR